MALKPAVWILLLLAGPLRAESEYLLSLAEGDIRIAADGTVEHIDLRTDLEPGDEAAMEGLIMRWQFEPIIEGGVAQAISAKLQVELGAVTTDDGKTHVGVQSVNFFEDLAAMASDWSGFVIVRPEWPVKARRAGALLVLRVNFDDEGRTHGITLEGGWGTGLAARRGAGGDKMVATLYESAKVAVEQWRFPPEWYSGCTMLAPFKFWLPWKGWQKARPLPRSQPAMTGANKCDGFLGPDGQPVSQRIRLRTQLNPPLPYSARGAE